MKRKSIVWISGMVFSLMLNAQTEFDALKYLQPDITGTARYSSMAGAFGALGADPSAIKDNPAGLGIYRSSELSATVNTLSQKTHSDWMRNESTDGLFKGGFNQLSTVLSTSPESKLSKSLGLKKSNWAFSFHRLKDYNRQMRVVGGSGVNGSATDYMAYFTANIPSGDLIETTNYNPYNELSLPWISVLAANAGLINEFVYDDTGETAYWESVLYPGETTSPSYYLRESGHFDEYSFSWSGNFNNRLFLGATVNLYDMLYTVESEYMESFSEIGSMSLKNYLASSSSGIGLRIGAIYIPVDNIRLGASVKTPVVFTNDDLNYADLYYNHGGNNFGTIQSPEGTNNYKLQTPLMVNLSAALIQGRKGLIGIEYVNSRNYSARFMDDSNNSFNFRYENDSIQSLFNSQHTFKIGGEYKLTDNVALRAGYAFSTAPTRNSLSKLMAPNTNRTDIEYFVPGTTRYLTGGIGYRETSWAFDLAFVNKTYNEDFYAYNPSKVDSNLSMPPASVTTTNLSILATLTFRY